jgi:hypothetical protein
MALAWNPDLGFGLLALATASCGPPDGPSMTVGNFTDQGELIASISYQLPSELRLADKHGGAPSRDPHDFVLAAVSAAGPTLYSFDGVAVDTDVAMLDAFPDSDYAIVAGTPSVSASLTGGTTPGITLLLDTPTVSLLTKEPNQAAPFASVTAWDERGFAVFPRSGGIKYWMVDAPSSVTSENDIDAPAYASLDVVRLREHVIVAGGLSDTVELLRFDGATDPSMLLSLMMVRNLHPSTGIGALSGFGGTDLAIAAARERVMVTWLSGSSVGYAVLRCEP